MVQGAFVLQFTELHITAFVLAVVNVKRDEMFAKPHFIAGWVLMGVTTLDVIAGAFRPVMSRIMRNLCTFLTL